MSVGRRTVTAVARAALVPLVLFTGVACSGNHGVGTTTDHRGSSSATATATADPHTLDANPRHLALGDCFDADRATLAGGLTPSRPVRIVPCTGPHLAEVFGRATYLEYDNPAKMAEDSKVYCANLAPRYDMDSWTLSPTADPVHFLIPTRAQWTAGDHNGICYWTPVPAPATSRLRHDRTTLTPDQYAYLDAADRPESAVAETPRARDEDDFNSYQFWAAGIADTYAAEAKLLQNRNWPTRAQAPVNALIQRLNTLIPLWRTASQSITLSEIEKTTHTAQAQATTTQERAVRAALSLTTDHKR